MCLSTKVWIFKLRKIGSNLLKLRCRRHVDCKHNTFISNTYFNMPDFVPLHMQISLWKLVTAVLHCNDIICTFCDSFCCLSFPAVPPWENKRIATGSLRKQTAFPLCAIQKIQATFATTDSFLSVFEYQIQGNPGVLTVYKYWCFWPTKRNFAKLTCFGTKFNHCNKLESFRVPNFSSLILCSLYINNVTRNFLLFSSRQSVQVP